MAKALCKVNNKIYDITKYPPTEKGTPRWQIKEETGRYDAIVVTESSLKEMFDEKYGTLKKI